MKRSSKPLFEEGSARLVTKGGIKLDVRPASPDDQQAVLDLLKDVAPEDLRFRFLDSVRPSEALAAMLTRVDHNEVENMLAFNADDGRLAATAMIAAQSRVAVEVAVVVRSDLKGRGIGWTMLSYACEIARARGYKRVECIELSDNRSAVTLEKELGFTSSLCPGDATLTILSKKLA